MILAIDFDGTIVDDCYPNIGEFKPGAAAVIQQLSNEGHYIIIWTCRAGKYLADAEMFLLENNIIFDQINNSDPGNIEEHDGVDTRKIYADFYIDDKAITPLPHWYEIYFIISKTEFLKS